MGSDKGIKYAGATIAQIMMQTDNNSMPKGLMRDYPEYEVRSTMLDLGRFYMPLDYVEEVTKYAAFYKLNEIHLHINDNNGEVNPSFRVESKLYPEINSSLDPDEVYSQEDYKAYQKEVKKYGIDVVTEIDTPGHSGFVWLYNQNYTYNADGYNLDLSNEAAKAFVKSVLDEFLDGDDPVFQNQKFNVGCDEYTVGDNELLRAYMNELIEYVNNKGYQTRLWSGLNVKGKPYGGNTAVSNEAVFHYWGEGYADLQVHLEGEYPIINNWGIHLYVVPNVSYLPDYLNIRNLYETWTAGVFQGGTLQPGHPLLKGAEAALWYDVNVGASEFDMFDRFRDMIMLMSEKNWYGGRTETVNSTADFMDRAATLGAKAPGVNPDRSVESESETIVKYDFGELNAGIVQDSSGNGYDATVQNLSVKNGALVLDGNGYVSLPFQSVGYPYTVKFKMSISGNTGSNAIMFSGEDGTMYYNYKGTGKIAYERKGYTYVFDYVVPTDVMTDFALTCTTPDIDRELHLYVNGASVAVGKLVETNYKTPTTTNSTFVLPTEKIGSGMIGSLKSMEITSSFYKGAQLGDPDDDGAYTSLDLVRLKKECLKTAPNTKLYDLNADGFVNAADVSYMHKLILGIYQMVNGAVTEK